MLLAFQQMRGKARLEHDLLCIEGDAELHSLDQPIFI